MIQLLILICSLIRPSTSIYTLQFQDIDGNTISMGQFEGKRILFVNIATGSTRITQLTALQQLHQQHGDSVVVIGFPSNSFGHEARSNAEIKQFCQTNYGVNFLLASKKPVTGDGLQAIYNWLTKAAENGVASQVVGGDFQKFVVSPTGELVGVFDPRIDPLDNSIIGALSQNY